MRFNVVCLLHFLYHDQALFYLRMTIHCLTVLRFPVSFTMTVQSGYKEHLFPHNHYCWRETQHIWQRWLAVIAGRVPSYAGVWLSRSLYSVFGKYVLHPPLNGREKAALPVWNPVYRDSEKILTAVGWIYGWAVLPGYNLHWGWLNPGFTHTCLGSLCGGARAFLLETGLEGPGSCCNSLRGIPACRGTLLLGRETSCGALTFYVHVRNVELPLYLSQILIGVGKQLLNMKLLETRSECRENATKSLSGWAVTHGFQWDRWSDRGLQRLTGVQVPYILMN